MNALISGRAGVALVTKGDEIVALWANRNEPQVLSAHQARLLALGERGDLVPLEAEDLATIRAALYEAVQVEDALQLLPLLFDNALEQGIRQEAAVELDELLGREELRHRLEDFVCAYPLPDSADWAETSRLAGDAEAPAVEAFVSQLQQRQKSIRRVRQAWEALPADVVDGLDLGRTIRQGGFRTMVGWLEANPALAEKEAPAGISSDAFLAWRTGLEQVTALEASAKSGRTRGNRLQLRLQLTDIQLPNFRIIDGGSLALAQYDLGLKALRARSYDQATKAFEQTIDKAPASADAHYYLALALFRGRRPKSLRPSECKKIEGHLTIALKEQGAAVPLLFAYLKHDFYVLNGMQERTPTHMELLRVAVKRAARKGELLELENHVPPIRAFIKDIFRPTIEMAPREDLRYQ